MHDCLYEQFDERTTRVTGLALRRRRASFG